MPPDTRPVSHARRLTDGSLMLSHTLAVTVTSVSTHWRSFLNPQLECSACRAEHPADQLQSVCSACGKVLFARYDLDAVRLSTRPRDFAQRRWDMWRYAELLPVRDELHVISLGEGLTPLIPVREGARRALGLERGALMIKEEGQNPTASFKARGLAAAIARARELGVHSVALPSAGNAGSAAAAYAAAGGLACVVAMPRDVPHANQIETRMFDAEVILVDGLIGDAGRLIREQAPA